MSFSDFMTVVKDCQLDDVRNVLNQLGKQYANYHSKLNDHQKVSAKKSFDSGDSPILLGINCLDEGLNVPDAQKCLIISSTANRRQFIQRRGRILRKPNPNSEKVAEIHDLVVVPRRVTTSTPPTEKEEKNVQRWATVVDDEFARIVDLISSANNKDTVMEQLREKADDIGVPWNP